MLKERALSLMKTWCDRLLDHTVGSSSPYIDGGLLCPACHTIHGRIGDLVLPLATLWAKTGEARYLERADKLIEFTEFNLKRPDGSYQNDAGSTWKGISAFSALALGDVLFEFGDRLPRRLYDKWLAIFRRLSDFAEYYFETIKPVVNYYAGASAELALAWKLLGDEKYLKRANRWESFCRECFDKNGLLFGEGNPTKYVSERGCHYIDMGYDLEESLPLLLRHAVLLEDREKFEFYRARFIDHLEFLLPDGAINNSFGTRHNKWTYWGSRTSDGIVEGLALVIDEPIFAKACDRVLTLWESCTHDGLLSIPMAADAGEPTCLHHSFCHAKALAVLINSRAAEAQDFTDALLPTELAYGIKSFQNGNLLNAAVGGWRATFSAIGISRYNGAENYGGSMTLLWHEKLGPICAATMHSYNQSEPHNMQYLRNSDVSPCMTPRIELDGRSTDTDVSAVLTYSGDEVNAVGSGWRAGYRFTDKAVTITVEADSPAVFVLPLICAAAAPAELDASGLHIGELTLACDHQIKADVSKRVFNQVGGFNYIPVEIAFSAPLTVVIGIG